MEVKRPGERTRSWWLVERAYARADFDADEVGRLYDWAVKHCGPAGRFALYVEQLAHDTIRVDLFAGEDPRPAGE